MALDDSKPSGAVDQLRDLFIQLDLRDSPSQLSRHSSPSQASDDMPKANEFYILLQAADEVALRLKDENDALHDENKKLQSNLVTLIQENNRLHEEIRSTFVSDMLRLINTDDGRPITNKESEIVELYTKQMRSLEMELKATKEKINLYETFAQAPNDLIYCLKCGTSLPFYQHAIENNEKFADIMKENETNKRKLRQTQVKLEQIEIQQQETLAKLQVSLAISEQNQFEKAEAIVDRDQIRIELVETQKRLRKYIDEMNETILNEKYNIETFFNDQLKESAEKARQIEEKCAQYELTIDRLIREKASLTADLDVWKERIKEQEIDFSQTSDCIKLKIQQVMRERDQANNKTVQIRSDFEKFLSQSNQNLIQLHHQLGATQMRLNEIENELLQSKKQCLDLIEEINRLTRENIMLKHVKQSLEKSREENLDTIIAILNQCEQDYRTSIQNLELERHQSLDYLENLVNNQNIILNKLRSYSQNLIDHIETILEQKAQIVQDITNENQEVRMKLSNAYERLEQVDRQLIQHNDTHIKLKQRIIYLDNKVKTYENMFNQIKLHD
ncbi:unnamed protein product [Rotaria socialis]|uniref:Uncharacterized protein n=1 Tax=Rotaria socialis TaxID=392032 RepID=A0A818B4T6_9BILA|nr:unnamed protein product [Rotaria socialis]CAF4541745.1 unnamed protein product [Rotaria socialis]